MPGYKSSSKFAENAEELSAAAPAEENVDAPAPTDEATAQEGGRRRRRRTRRKSKSKKSRKAKKSKTRKAKRGKRTRKKRGLNPFFKLMLAAKKKGAASFKYNGKTYKGRKHKRLGMIYKKA